MTTTMSVAFNIRREILDANANGGKSAQEKCRNCLAKWLFHPPALPKIQQISETQEISANISKNIHNQYQS
jgi:hypothetical protein